MDNPEKVKTPDAGEQPATKPDTGTESGLYDRFAELSHDAFTAGQEKGREAWEKAMESARRKMTEAGEFTSEQGEAFKRYLRRDMEQTGEHMRQLGKEAKESLNPSRVGAGALSSLTKLLHVAGNALTELSSKTESALEYESGEITSAGTLTCLSCGHQIPLKKTSVVPECPSCKGKRFRKGY